MALLNLSLVTEALIRLIRLQVKDSPAWSGAEPPVSPLPPDKVTGGGLGLYLYHLTEDAQYKNLPAPAGNTPPVRYTPMGLTLYYLLSAHSAAEDENAYYQSQ